MLTSTRRAALLASLLLLSAGAIGVATTAKAGSDDAQVMEGSKSLSQQSLVEREKPEAGGRVIKRSKQAAQPGTTPERTSAVACRPEPTAAERC